MNFFLVGFSLTVIFLISDVHSFRTLESLKQKAEFINNLKTTWTATYHNVPTNITLGAILDFDNRPKFKTKKIIANDIPEKFDTRENWPECQEITTLIRDQGSCGSCWAVAAVSVISDRICIASKGQKKVLVSAEDLLSCCGEHCGNGCNGGFIGGAFIYYVKHGIVSGGNFGDKNTCRPYEIPECSHHTNGTKPTCSKIVDTPKCERKCLNGADYREDLQFGSDFYYLSGSIQEIQAEIIEHGPVEAGFTVFDDFFLYKSGVYQTTPGAKPLGGHAVKIIGWGIENNTPYWLVVNSWNNEWGDNGYFKILRGVNHCFIENWITAGIPQL